MLCVIRDHQAWNRHDSVSPGRRHHFPRRTADESSNSPTIMEGIRFDTTDQ